MEPFDGVFAYFDLWVKDSALVLGRSILNNSSPKQFTGTIAWVLQFTPREGGVNAVITNNRVSPFIHGISQDENFVFLANGSAAPGKIGQISLENDCSILPGAQQTFQWAFSLAGSLEHALEKANSGIAANWEAEIARIEIINQKDVFEIETGNRDWNLALMMSQHTARQLLIGKPAAENEQIAMKSRNPEQRLMSEFNAEKKIQSFELNPLELWHFLQTLPSAAGVIWEKIDRELDIPPVKSPEKRINSLLPAKLLPFPILAETVWEIYQLELNLEPLRLIFPKILHYLQAWDKNRPQGDADSDPVWSNPLQSLLEILPIHNHWDEYSGGLDTKWIKSPMLLSLLFNEFEKACQIAKVTDMHEKLAWLEERRGHYKKRLNSCWNSKKSRFGYQDIVSQKAYAGGQIFKTSGSGKHTINKTIKWPQRLSIKFLTLQEHTRHVKLILRGNSNDAQVTEEIHPRNIHWHGRLGFYTTQHLYRQISSLEILHSPAEDQIMISTSNYDHSDVSLVLPVWAQACDPKRVHAMTEKWLVPDFSQPFGLPYVPIHEQPQGSDLLNHIDLPINCMAVLGLLQYGYKAHARQIWTNNLSAVVKNLKLFRRTMKYYDASDGYGSGDYNIINGVLPISLFLRLAGIEKWSKSEVVINRLSVFEEAIMIRYRGNIITTTANGHEFCSPGGGKISTTGSGPHRIRIPD